MECRILSQRLTAERFKRVFQALDGGFQPLDHSLKLSDRGVDLQRSRRVEVTLLATANRDTFSAQTMNQHPQIITAQMKGFLQLCAFLGMRPTIAVVFQLILELFFTHFYLLTR